MIWRPTSLRWPRIDGQLVRDYWSVVPLVALAGILLVAAYKSSVEDNSLIAVGWGFTGAAIVRWVDIAQERRRARVKAQEDRQKDLDETRRLLYMALFQTTHNGPEFVATLVNALAHHGLNIDPDEAAASLRISGAPRVLWIREQIELVNARLQDDSKQ